MRNARKSRAGVLASPLSARDDAASVFQAYPPPMKLLAAALLAAALPAQAQVYKWVDANGQANYSNAPPASAAGSTQRVEERISILGMDPYVRADAERRHAAQAAQVERDWQLRQQAMSVQYAQPLASYMDYGYHYPYYGAGYYAAAYGAGYYRPAIRHHVRHHHHGGAPRVTPHARTARAARR